MIIVEMKKIYFVSITAGRVTEQGLTVIQSAQQVWGSASILFGELIDGYQPDSLSQVVSYIQGHPAPSTAILLDGGKDFYSESMAFLPYLEDYQPEWIADSSTADYLLTQIGEFTKSAVVANWDNIVDMIRRNETSFLLVRGEEIKTLQQRLSCFDESLVVTVGEGVGRDVQQMTTTKMANLPTETGKLYALLFQNPKADSSQQYGIPDEEFIRGKVPMTKSEVRSVTMSKLLPKPWEVCYDIGAGTGSVTIEMALSAYQGKVYAIERNAEAVELIHQNCKKFHLGNVRVLAGSAPEVLAPLPPPDVVFIGGSGGEMQEIFRCLLEKNPAVRIVINAITLETVLASVNAFQHYGIQPDITQLQLSKSRSIAGLHMMMAQNPIFIINN